MAAWNFRVVFSLSRTATPNDGDGCADDYGDVAGSLLGRRSSASKAVACS